jgi:hypothetical protein
MVILVVAMWIENKVEAGSRAGGLEKISWHAGLASRPGALWFLSPGRRLISVEWDSVGRSAVAAAGSPGGAAAPAGPCRGRVRGVRTQ